MNLCARHNDALEMALELRGLLRPTLTADVDRTPMDVAKSRIADHASNFAGRAAVRMLAEHHCPICFVNAEIRRQGKNPGLTCDGWVDNAADEALDDDISRKDALTRREILV